MTQRNEKAEFWFCIIIAALLLVLLFAIQPKPAKASTGTIIGFQWNRAFAVSEKQNGPFKITGYYESFGMDKEPYWFYYELSDNEWVSRKIESYIVVVRTNYLKERTYTLKMDEWMDLQIGDTVLCKNSTITPVKNH